MWRLHTGDGFVVFVSGLKSILLKYGMKRQLDTTNYVPTIKSITSVLNYILNVGDEDGAKMRENRSLSAHIDTTAAALVPQSL